MGSILAESAHPECDDGGAGAEARDETLPRILLSHDEA